MFPAVCPGSLVICVARTKSVEVNSELTTNETITSSSLRVKSFFSKVDENWSGSSLIDLDVLTVL